MSLFEVICASMWSVKWCLAPSLIRPSARGLSAHGLAYPINSIPYPFMEQLLVRDTDEVTVRSWRSNHGVDF